MKLYVFDSCPFCARSLMLIGLKNIDCSIDYLLADDVDTPTRMIGKKNVPILEKDDGTYLGESWEINHYIDEIDSKPLMGEIPETPSFESWYKSIEKEYDLLCYPRMAKLGMPELGSDSAMDYFVSSRKKVMGMTLDSAFAQTDELITIVQPSLDQLCPTLNHQAGEYGQVTFDDFYLFPLLRGLTMVKGLIFPKELENYLLGLSQRTGIDLYFDRVV